MRPGTRIDARDPAVVRMLEQLREAGCVTAFGFVTGSTEAWVRVHPGLAALVEAGCGPLLDPGFWADLMGDVGSHEARTAA